MSTVIITAQNASGDTVLPRTLAKAVSYDGTTSGMQAATVQGAVDELVKRIDDKISVAITGAIGGSY